MPHKYGMNALQNILDIYQFTSLMNEGKKDPRTPCPWWDDCIRSIIQSVHQDQTTTKDNLRDKALSYAMNYLALCPEASHIKNDQLFDEIADEIVEKLKDDDFDQRPPANIVAQQRRSEIPQDPEERFIKLR